MINRRSINTFKNKSIETQVLKEIFAYASWAPTHYMKEPWEIKLYQGHGKVTLINKIIKSYQRLEMLSTDNDAKTVKSIKDFLLKIPHHAVVYFERENDPINMKKTMLQSVLLFKMHNLLHGARILVCYGQLHHLCMILNFLEISMLIQTYIK